MISVDRKKYINPERKPDIEKLLNDVNSILGIAK